MPFNSVTFGLFLAVFLAAYWSAPPRLRNGVIVAGSYVFYGWWDWRFLGLLAVSTGVDFTLARRLQRTDDSTTRRGLVWASAGVNLGILAGFKYLNFFADSFGRLLDGLGLGADPATLRILLPVGISFYTFQTMSYTIDVYRRRIDATDDFVSFAAYVAYFPQLVAGPIERARHLLPQILTVERTFPRGDRLSEAVRLIVVGLAKKVVLADGVAEIANRSFAEAASASWLMLAVGVVAFAIQIYGDFCGYTDIARGVSLLLGIDLVVNFTEPYLSRNITEFWRRWHISLSDWLRDYLYISLGGNRRGTLNTYRNLMITMLLGGLWHGASWNFVVWGGLHGLFLVVHKLTRGGSVPAHEPRLRDVPAMLATLAVVLGAWIFFRAETFGQALDVVSGIVTLRSGSLRPAEVVTVALFAAVTVATDLWQRRHAVARAAGITRPVEPTLVGAGAGALVVATVVFSGGSPVPFIYFQF